MWYNAVGGIVMLTLSLLAAPLVAEALRPAKVPRIGILSLTSPSSAAEPSQGWREGLRDLGYVEGQNITFEERYAEGKRERLPALAAELVQLQVDVIVAGGGPIVVRAAQEATSTIPIVMTSGADPVRDGLVVSLARPGGNVTGVVLFPGTEIVGKMVELLKEALPQITHVAVLLSPPSSASVHETERTARALGLHLHLLEVRRADELDSAFAAITRTGAEALIVLPAAEFHRERRRIVDLVAASRLPALYEHRAFVEVGGLMSYGPNPAVVSRRAAFYVDRILKGAKPADLPVEQPTRIELVINLQTAQILGLTLPPAFLFRADAVFQ
jgi:putative ABC transport system substrate-binding protein